MTHAPTAQVLLTPRSMTSTRYHSRPCAILFAVVLGSCVAADDGVVDLGSLDDGKSDTILPRTVEIELDAGASKRFRITAPAFLATLDQADGDVDAELIAKHFELELTSEVSRAPRVQAVADGTVRNWTLTVFNRGDATLTATLLVDLPRVTELGIVSDIDKTVMPPELPTGLSPPYPGIATLLDTLELRGGGARGDVHYVTARTPDGVAEVPEWMALHGVPEGTIDTGISGIPAIAQKEKVADISRLFDARIDQRFVLFGDTAHRDPEVYKDILARFPGRVAAVFINKVNVTVSPDRVVGMNLVNNYAEAAAIAFGLELLTETEARRVIDAARTEGLAITDAEIDALIDAAR